MKRNLPAFLLLTAATCGFPHVSCSQVQPSVYGSFDARQKTLAVPATNFGGIPVVKDNLRKAGWDIRVANANTALRMEDGIMFTIYDNKDAREILSYAGPIEDNKNKNDIVSPAVIDNTH